MQQSQADSTPVIQRDARSIADGDRMLTSDRIGTIALLIATAVVFYLAFLLVKPFLTALAWAMALAIIGMPVHRWIAARVRQQSLAAGLSMVILAIAVVAPTAWVAQQLVSEAIDGASMMQNEMQSGSFRESVAGVPGIGDAFAWVERTIDLKQAAQQIASGLSGAVSSFVQGSIGAFVQTLIVFFCLFFFLRDRDQFMETVRDLIPLTRIEADRVLARVRTTVRATVFGTLVIAAIQGTLGGLMFWWLGLPLPILWGAVMGLLAIVPVLGAFVIWIPAAIFLALTGEIGKAVILAVWGAVVIGLIDNLLYPALVGGRVRLHTLPVFFSIVGGLALFGTAGLILGPVVLAVTAAVIDIWRRRMLLMEGEEASPEPAGA